MGVKERELKEAFDGTKAVKMHFRRHFPSLMQRVRGRLITPGRGKTEQTIFGKSGWPGYPLAHCGPAKFLSTQSVASPAGGGRNIRARYYFLRRGGPHSAVMREVKPPRAFQSAMIVRLRGFNAAPRSSQIRLVTASKKIPSLR